MWNGGSSTYKSSESIPRASPFERRATKRMIAKGSSSPRLPYFTLTTAISLEAPINPQKRLKRQKNRFKTRFRPFSDKSQLQLRSFRSWMGTAHSTSWYMQTRTRKSRLNGVTAMPKISKTPRRCSSGVSVPITIGWKQWLAIALLIRR